VLRHFYAGYSPHTLELVMEAVKVNVAQSFVTVTLAGLIVMTLSVVCVDSHPIIARPTTTIEL
jgi:hypothetical protein